MSHRFENISPEALVWLRENLDSKNWVTNRATNQVYILDDDDAIAFKLRFGLKSKSRIQIMIEREEKLEKSIEFWGGLKNGKFKKSYD